MQTTVEGCQEEGTVCTRALEVGWQTLGELDPGTEELSVRLEQFWKERDRKGSDSTLSCDPRLRVRIKSKVQWKALKEF